MSDIFENDRGSPEARPVSIHVAGIRRGRWRAGVILLALAGCGKGNVYQPPPPPEVVVTTPVEESVTVFLSRTGTTQASERVELRARVKGFLTERAFKDGEAVKAGQLLFVIDEEPFRIRLAQLNAKVGEAEAALKKTEQSKLREITDAKLKLDEADLELAKLSDERIRNLFSKNAISREERDRSEANLKKSEAQVLSDQANLQQVKADYETNILSAQSTLAAARSDARIAEIDLGYCRITAPIAGRINSREFDVGNYVGDGDSIGLAAIVKVDPIYAYITLGEDELLRVQRAQQATNPPAPLPIEMVLSDETAYPHRGQVDYVDPSVDTGTGTVRLRGIFPNPGGTLMPGLFVKLRIPSEQRDSLLVPDRAVGSDQGGSYLLVVDKDDNVERRAVQVGIQIRDLREVKGAIAAEDRVVVDGLLRARPGLKVAPKMEQPASTATASHTPAKTKDLSQ